MDSCRAGAEKKRKELLVKSDVAQAALEVKLRHTRNQLDVEIKKRYKTEADYQCLERQMQLICDVLVHDSKSSACLNDEQRSVLTSFSHKGASVPQHRGKQYLNLQQALHFVPHLDNTAFVKLLKSRARERRRSLMDPSVGPPIQKRGREIEATVVKESVTTPETRAVYIFYMIHPETCMPCGKRIRFGKLAIKCRDCRMVSHPESKQLCLERCSPNAHGSAQLNEETLESFAASTRPWIPSLIVQCVHEIERRGLEEVFLFNNTPTQG
ncbi:hypothetical protein cypCar_00027317 [Cyprinus carpio]|nr:hypothetical protein cypCar_00027317 [Cyprinus carpio]